MQPDDVSIEVLHEWTYEGRRFGIVIRSDVTAQINGGEVWHPYFLAEYQPPGRRIERRDIINGWEVPRGPDWICACLAEELLQLARRGRCSAQGVGASEM